MAESSREGRVFLVGAGPGDPGLLTLRAAELLRDAEVLLYDALASDAIVALAPPACERIFVGKRGRRPSNAAGRDRSAHDREGPRGDGRSFV